MSKNTFEGKRAPVGGSRIPENPIKICSAISRLHRGIIRESGLLEGVMTQPGARLVMPLLAVHGELSQVELVQMTHLKAPSISAILKKMEDEGLVERRFNPNDRREIRVSLTKKGMEVDHSIVEALKSTDEAGLAGLSDAEKETLMSLLCRIRENLLYIANEKEN